MELLTQLSQDYLIQQATKLTQAPLQLLPYLLISQDFLTEFTTLMQLLMILMETAIVHQQEP